MTTTDVTDLAAQLWRQRRWLEMLLFKYQEEGLIAAAGMTRWSAHAAREIDAVMERLDSCSPSTAAAISAVAVAWALPSEALLRDLVDRAPTPVWRQILSEHLNALVELVHQIRDVAAQSPESHRADGSARYAEQTARLIDGTLQ